MELSSLIDQLEHQQSSTDFTRILSTLSQIQPLLSLSDFEELIQMTSNYTILEDLDVITKPITQFENIQALFLYVHGSTFTNIIKRLDWKAWSLTPHTIQLFQLILIHDEFSIDELNDFKSMIPLSDIDLQELTLLLLFHGQVVLKPSLDQDTVPSILLANDVSFNFVLLYNRADSILQKCMVQVLFRLLQLNQSYFYTNDLVVLFDVTLRQVTRVDDSVRSLYIELLPVIVDCMPPDSGLKEQMVEKLESIRDGPLTPTSITLLANRILSTIK